MTYWSIAALILSLSFLAYRHPPAVNAKISAWLGRLYGPKHTGGEQIEPDAKTDTTSDHIFQDSGVKIDVVEPAEEVTTPKASATSSSGSVQGLAFNDDGDTSEQSKAIPESPKPKRPASSISAAEYSQRASTLPSPPKALPNGGPISAAALMPPPPRPVPAARASSAAALRVPSNGPLPNRGPPINSQQRASGGLTVNGAVPIPNPRGKVLLAPGHSPMDWAALTRSGNLSGVSSFQRVTPSVLKSMTGRKGKPAWSSYDNNVYNITPYVPFHPGGEAEIVKAAGRDGKKLFMEVHPWVNWDNMLSSCLVGVLVPENYGMGEVGGSSLEDMD